VKVEVTQTDKFTRSLAVEVPAEEVEAARRAVLREIRAQAALPGFRKGKAPDAELERRFANTIREQTVERVLEPAAREALENVHDLAAQPRVKELHYEPGQPLSFVLTVEVRPRVSVEGYKGQTMVREVYEIEDEDVTQAVNDLRERAADLVPAYRRAQEGDVVVADVAEVVQGAEVDESAIRRGVAILLTPDLLEEPLGRSLVGTIGGDERRVAPDPAEPQKELWVRVTDVRERVLPAADDAFFKSLGLGETEAVGRARIHQLLREEEDHRSLRAMAARIVDDLLARNPIEPTPSQLEVVKGIVARETAKAAEEGREAPDAPALEASLMRELQREILLESIAAQENITVADEEIDAEIRRLAERARVSPAEARRRLEADNRLDTLRRDMLRGKVLGFLVQQASVRVDTKRREGRSRIILPGDATGARGSIILPGRT
jgi:trigger factor